LAKTTKFICENCHKVFRSVDDGAAMTEFEAEFPGFDVSDVAVVCSECYDELLPKIKEIENAQKC